jgi:HD-GYP domain-containing protein (c-di-GMP phosphodiesterase class II)
MKQFFKHYYLLIIAQTACLALGLWLEHQFVESLISSDLRGVRNAASMESNNAVGGANREFTEYAVRAMALAWIAGLQIVVAYLVLTRDREEAARKKRKAEKISLQQYDDLLRTRDAVIFGLAKLAESRDPDTGNHLERIAIYSTRLASALRRDPRYAGRITPAFVKLIGISSALHDIGKVGIRDAILLKPGKFDGDDRRQMERHAEIGGRCVREIESRLGRSNFLHMAREIAFCHHERWDGKGYPKGLAGEEIPLAARIVAVADAYDAMASKRIYKEAFPHERCVEIIGEESGKQFDPALVEVFLKLEAEFREIARNCRDATESRLLTPSPSGETQKNPQAAEMSIEEKFSVLETALDQCASDSPLGEILPRDAYRNVEYAPLNQSYEIELEPENVP